MTFIGKLLAVLNLVIGIGMASWATALYTNRLPWFEPTPPPEMIHPGHKPANFNLLKEELDHATRAATTASQQLALQLTELQQLERTRTERLRLYETYLTYARTGNPNDNGTGFYEPVFDPATGLLDLTPPAPGRPRKPLLGPDNRPLRGVDTIGSQYINDVNEVIKLSKQLDAYRMRFQTLGVEILQMEERLRKMTEIRDSVLAELFYLEDVRWNVYEQLEQLQRRQRQLSQRLAELRSGP